MHSHHTAGVSCSRAGYHFFQGSADEGYPDISYVSGMGRLVSCMYLCVVRACDEVMICSCPNFCDFGKFSRRDATHEHVTTIVCLLMCVPMCAFLQGQSCLLSTWLCAIQQLQVMRLMHSRVLAQCYLISRRAHCRLHACLRSFEYQLFADSRFWGWTTYFCSHTLPRLCMDESSTTYKQWKSYVQEERYA